MMSSENLDVTKTIHNHSSDLDDITRFNIYTHVNLIKNHMKHKKMSSPTKFVNYAKTKRKIKIKLVGNK